MNKKNDILVLTIGFLISFLTIGIPYWKIPYQQVALPNSIFDYGLALSFIVSIILRSLCKTPFLKTFVFIGLAAPIAVLWRVNVDIGKDPTSHNLWPLEVILTSVVSFGVSLAGSLVSSLFLLIAKNNGNS